MRLKTKLLHVTSSLKTGGAEQVLYDIVTSLVPHYEQTVIYFHGGRYEKLLQAQGIPIIHIQGLFFRYDLFFWIRLFIAIRRIRPDKIHSLLWIANVASRLIARFLAIPYVNVLHNNVTQNGRVRACIDYVTFSQQDTLVTVSEEVRDALQMRYTWLPTKNITVISNGISIEDYAAKAANTALRRNALGYTHQQYIIGSVGRFVPVKRFDFLLKSFALVHQKYPFTHLLLVGTGPDEQALRSQAVELGIDQVVRFVINQPAIDYYGIFNCFVMSSAQEGVSLALLEAMSSKIPCIVTNNAAPMHTVLTHAQNGLVVSSDSIKGLAAALERCIIEQSMAHQLAEHAFQTVKTGYSKERMVRDYINLFERLAV
jgi:glycosyltransferase involved in cell wall biosynthesis